MAAIDWTADFCLGCDTQTDGAAYCSNACRLLEYEKTSESCSTLSSSATTPTSSTPSSPSIYGAPAYPWSTQRSSGISMSPSPAVSRLFPVGSSLDFRHRNIPSSSSSSSTHLDVHYNHATPTNEPSYMSLTPSSSRSSLCSMQTTTSIMSGSRMGHGPDSVTISDRASKELREYAMSLEYVKLQRRRSY